MKIMRDEEFCKCLRVERLLGKAEVTEDFDELIDLVMLDNTFYKRVMNTMGQTLGVNTVSEYFRHKADLKTCNLIKVDQHAKEFGVE